MGERESGQMVLKKGNGPILMHIYNKQCEIMQIKEGLKHADSVFSQ